MVDREHVSQPPLLPQVSKETIVERFGNSLKIGIEPKGKRFYRPSGLVDLLDRLHQTAPGFSLGGLRVLDLLGYEAQKKKENLPHISMEDVDNYIKNHPIFNVIIRRLKGEKIKNIELRDIRDTISPEYTSPSFEKFRPENPDLVSHLEQVYDRNVQLAQKATGYPRFQIEAWRIGALYTYELLRNQTEKEKMKRLDL